MDRDGDRTKLLDQRRPPRDVVDICMREQNRADICTVLSRKLDNEIRLEVRRSGRR